jgi:hypothetical protein
MSAFGKGHKRLGGRKKGTLNRVTESIKNALNALLSEDELMAHWETFLQHRNPHIALRSVQARQLLSVWQASDVRSWSRGIATSEDRHQRDPYEARTGS